MNKDAVLRAPPRKATSILRWPTASWKFATELKSAPDKDVADLGGWKDLNTLREIYQMADKDTMLKALASRLELREAQR